jgi:AcrR family transcriptional regulator
MPTSATTPSPRYQDARRRLYESAMRLFRTKGYAATTADEIAATAGMSRASFFNHFGNKSAVLRFYGQELEETICATLAARDPAASPLGELRRILLAMTSAAEAQRENLRIVLVHSIEDGTYFSQPTPVRARIFKAIAALLADAQARGEARTDLPSTALATQTVALYNNAVVDVLFSSRSAEAAIDRLWEFALGGLTTAPVARATTASARKRKAAR